MSTDPKQSSAESPIGDFDSVPVIDFWPMLSGDPTAKAAMAAALREACANVGFFYIAGHGIPQTLIDEMFAECPRFFGRPLEDNMRIHVKKSSHLLGYVAMMDENANPATGKGDLHEAFDFAPPDMVVDGELMPGDVRKAGNLWPDDLSGFQDTMLRYAEAVKRLSRQIFRAFALALDLPEDYFRDLASVPMTLIRLLHYPTQPGSFDESRMGNGAHTDHECFTILCQDGVKALQVRNRRGDWIDAPPIRGTFVVNIGDLMARWTNGIFASTFHRVANHSGRVRYSIPCFVGANADAVIQALPSCVSPDNPAKYPPVVAGEYIQTLIYHNFHNNHEKHPLKQGAA